MTAPAYVSGTGDLIWTYFDPTKGREQAGRRPALVVSAVEFTKNTGLDIVCPITSVSVHFQPVSFCHQAYRSPVKS
jgi:mRNA interferase MazF